MPLVLVGVLLLLARMAELGPFASLSWWWVAAPFAGAIVWWHFADSSGWTQRQAMNKMDRRKAERRQRAMDALGLNSSRERQVNRAREDAARRVSADPTQGDNAVADRLLGQRSPDAAPAASSSGSNQPHNADAKPGAGRDPSSRRDPRL